MLLIKMYTKYILDDNSHETIKYYNVSVPKSDLTVLYDRNTSNTEMFNYTV